MIVAIHQPNYLPWLGYFRKIAMADRFVFFDNVRMPMNKSFVSRNAIKTAKGRQWLTVPVVRGGDRAIVDTVISDHHWSKKHLRTIEQAYAHSAWCRDIVERLGAVMARRHDRLAALNIDLVRLLCELIGLSDTEFRRASEMDLTACGGASIGEILATCGASVYLTGEGAGSRRYLDQLDLPARGIEVRVVPDGFDEYQQAHGPFEPNLSALDCLLNIGGPATRELIAA